MSDKQGTADLKAQDPPASIQTPSVQGTTTPPPIPQPQVPNPLPPATTMPANVPTPVAVATATTPTPVTALEQTQPPTTETPASVAAQAPNANNNSSNSNDNNNASSAPPNTTPATTTTASAPTTAAMGNTAEMLPATNVVTATPEGATSAMLQQPPEMLPLAADLPYKPMPLQINTSLQRGGIFSSKDALISAVRLVCAAQDREYIIVRRTALRICFQCPMGINKCEFRVNANRKTAAEDFKIGKSCLQHSCDGSVRRKRNVPTRVLERDLTTLQSFIPQGKKAVKELQDLVRSDTKGQTTLKSGQARKIVSKKLQEAKKTLYFKWSERLVTHLRDVTTFWLQNSVDQEHGGFYTCLDRDGSIYDNTKYMWLQCRQIWMLSRLFNANGAFQFPELVNAIEKAVSFVREHGKAPNGRIFFALDPEGKPVKLQRKIFSEAFYAMALSEYALTIKAQRPKDAVELFAEAVQYFENVVKFTEDPSLIDAAPLAGTPNTQSLDAPMITLNALCELRRFHKDDTLFQEVADSCVDKILLHFNREKKAVLEHVGPHGEFINSSQGRLTVPGHALEAAWFLLEYVAEFSPKNKDEIIDRVLEGIEWSIELGWDLKNGGLFYYMDVDGYPPQQLEWSMKLWWVHTEAMVAALYAYSFTKHKKWWDLYEKVASYTLVRFSDDKHNTIRVELLPRKVLDDVKRVTQLEKPSMAFFGYLARDGSVSQRCIGGAYKGFFHVPRALFKCAQLLDSFRGTQ